MKITRIALGMGESPMQKREFALIAEPITRNYNEPIEVNHGFTASQEY